MYLVSREIVPLIRPGGRIINTASVLGRFGVPGYTAYCASKHGVIGFTRALALELAPHQITVNAICPGWVDTELSAALYSDGGKERIAQTIPLKRVPPSEDIAGPILFLMSDWARHITGEILNVNGGSVLCG